MENQVIVSRPWIAYVAPVSFPEGGAAARRILGNAKAIAAGGYDVIIVSGQRPESEGTIFELAPGVRCVCVNERDAEHLPKALRYSRYALMGLRSRRWLAKQTIPPVAVILYSGYTPYLLQLRNWTRIHRIPFLFDAVEWYTATKFHKFLFSPYLWNTEIAMRALIPRVDAVISISRALEYYYTNRGLEVLRVPPLFDPVEITLRSPSPDPLGRIRLVYSGTPGHKDLLDTVIESVVNCNHSSEIFLLEIVGLTESEVLQRAPFRNSGGVLPRCIRAHGYVSHERSLDIVGQADFSVFLRHVNRVSKCGFPTKFVESLALGTPVISNLTSDLSDFLRDGETGFVCDEPSRESLERALMKTLTLTTQSRQSMRVASRTEAERFFRYDKFSQSLCNFVMKLQH